MRCPVKSTVLLVKRCLALVIALGLMTPVSAQWHSSHFTAMTTRIELEFWEPDAERAKALSLEVVQLFEEIEQRMSRYREDSELSVLNRSAYQKPMPVSRELFEVLTEAQSIARLTQGAFDITFASLGYLYDYRARRLPSDQQRDALQALINYQLVQLDSGGRSVRYAEKGVLVDLGGIAKGYAVDQAIALLATKGVRSARLSAGGDMRLLGSKRGEAWTIGIKDPRQPEDHAVVLPLEDIAISTSGDYERYFIDAQGKRIHHILSPKTGKPAQGIQSVTVIGPRAIRTDGLSTAIFVLGVEKGLSVIENIDGYDAIIIDAQRKMHYSQGLMAPEASSP